MKKIVIGLGFGDEGKGLVTDWLCRNTDSPTVVRYSGGHQAGHCVRTKDEKHIFSNFGSGTLVGAPTYWNAKTFDPVGFYNERLFLQDYEPRIEINPDCPVTTPMDKIVNWGREKRLNHGSVGVGFGTTLTREQANYHLIVRDLYNPTVLRLKYELIKQWYIDHKGYDCDGFYGAGTESIDDDKKKQLAEMEREFFHVCDHIVNVEWIDNFSRPTGGNYIYESSQGLLLDMDYGFFPYCTPSRVGTQELNVEWDDELYLVTRAYSTRHGAGPTVMFDCNITAEDETNVYGEYQKNFKTGALDISFIKYAMEADAGIRHKRKRNLVITCLDHMNYYTLSENGILNSYVSEELFLDEIIKRLPAFNNIYVSHGPTAGDIKLYKSF